MKPVTYFCGDIDLFLKQWIRLLSGRTACMAPIANPQSDAFAALCYLLSLSVIPTLWGNAGVQNRHIIAI